MKCGLPPGCNGNFGSVGEQQFCIGVAVYMVEVDEKRLMNGVEEQLGELFTQVIKFVSCGICLFRSNNTCPSAVSRHIENIVRNL
mgnify:CR=1 FL=1